MTSVRMTARGLDVALAKVQAQAERAKNLAPVLAVMAQQITTAIDDSFRSGTGMDGIPFAANTPATIKRKGSSKPAIDTGRFRGSISARVAGRTTIGFGTNTPYAGPVISGSRRHGTLKHASYAGGSKRARGTPWSVVIPGRNPFPVTPSGQWIGVGRGEALRAKLTRTLAAYVATGRTS